MRARLPGRNMTHQSFGRFSSSSRISNFPPVLAFTAAQTRRNDTRIVQNQHVAGAEKFQQIRKSPVFEPVPVAMQNQQPRFIPFGRGMLRDQFRRQNKIKISGSHRAKV